VALHSSSGGSSCLTASGAAVATVAACVTPNASQVFVKVPVSGQNNTFTLQTPGGACVAANATVQSCGALGAAGPLYYNANGSLTSSNQCFLTPGQKSLASATPLRANSLRHKTVGYKSSPN
jgi:hypothetical protein